MPTPTIASAPVILSGRALARVTAMSVSPTATQEQSAHTLRDRDWFELNVDVFVGDGSALTSKELAALFA